MDCRQGFNVSKKYLLVSEGPTDFIIIKHISRKISSTIGSAVNIVEISPTPDATTGTYPGHGWGGIKAWCRKYSRNKSPASVSHLPPLQQQLLLRLNWPALIAINGADGIIIQIDSDIAHLLKSSTPYQPGSCRSTHCYNEVLFWLNEDQKPQEIYLAISALAIETWLLATHPPTDKAFNNLPKNFNYETVSDFEDRLVALKYPSYNDGGRRRLKKSPAKTYEPHGQKIADNLSDVRTRCVAADALCTHLES